MEPRNKLTLCRLCLCKNECFVNIFERNDCQGYVAAEVISDLLKFQVTTKPEEMIIGSNSNKVSEDPVKEAESEEVIIYSSPDEESEYPCDEAETQAIIKSEEVIIYSSSNEESKGPCDETENEVSHGPILLKYEVLPLGRGSHPQEELIDSETFGNLGTVELTATLMQDSPQVQLAAVDSVTKPHNLRLAQNVPHISLSEGLEASSSQTVERLEGQRILPGKRICKDPLIQEDSVEVEKKSGRIEKEMDGEGPGRKRTAPEKGLECYHCGNMLMTKDSLIRHMRLHGFGHTYDCDVCGKTFQSKFSIVRHALTHTGYNPYKCDECSKNFGRNDHLKRHLSSNALSIPRKCPKCRESYSLNCKLKMHMRSHTGRRPYTCSECSKSFSRNAHLKTHMRIHTGSKPYTCTECVKSFSTTSSLKMHMSSHTGFKPYECAECSKCFCNSGDLKRHMRAHTGAKPYKCAECGKSFSLNGNLKRHMRSHRF